ncbi:MAG: ABC transporter substrate-binding protein [Haloplanus sp.]
MAIPTARRRTVLAALVSGATALTSGCLRRVRALNGWASPQQVQLRIKTLPADEDPYAVELARRVAEWFRTAGFGVSVVPMAEQELLRQTLLQHEFDLFVMRLPARFRNPDALVTLLHSRFADAAGWQNPFGYANLDVDELLETQRRATGDHRQDVLEQLQRSVARTQPFTLLTVPDDIRAARTSTYTNWRDVDLESPLGYLRLERRSGSGGEGESTLRIVVADHRATMNLNPLSVEFRRNAVLTGLLYDPLGYEIGDEIQPWLADSWEVIGEAPPVARLDLHERARWHDGERLTASDVAFTYELLADTTMGSDDEDIPIPSPRFRGRTDIIDSVEVVDASTVVIRFDDVSPSVARRAFSVPILPEHIWTDRSGRASIGGIDLGAVTEALVTNNIPPVGSGPFRFVRNTPREELVLERFDDHFLNRETPADWNVASERRPPFDRVIVRAVGSDDAAVGVVGSGDGDVTGTAVGSETVPRIGRGDDLELVVERSDSPYMLGYNTRRRHLNNPQVRHLLASLIDNEHLVESVHRGYGRPAVGPLWDTPWYPDQLEWTTENPVTPFLGTDGTLDEQRVRAAFENAGYRYEDGVLLGGE